MIERIELKRACGRYGGLRFEVNVYESDVGLPRSSWVELDGDVPEWMALLGTAGAVLADNLERMLNDVLVSKA